MLTVRKNHITWWLTVLVQFVWYLVCWVRSHGNIIVILIFSFGNTEILMSQCVSHHGKCGAVVRGRPGNCGAMMGVCHGKHRAVVVDRHGHKPS